MDRISVLIVYDHPMLRESPRGTEPFFRIQRLSSRYLNWLVIPVEFMGVAFGYAESMEESNAE